MIGKKRKSPDGGGGKIKREAGIWIAFVIIALYSLTLLTPFYYMVNNSFKRVDDFLQNGAWSLPKTLHFQNYKDAVSLAAGGVSRGESRPGKWRVNHSDSRANTPTAPIARLSPWSWASE